MSVDNRSYDLAVAFLSGIGDINARKILKKFGDAKSVFKASLSELQKTPGIGEYTAKKLYNSFSKALNMAEEELMYIYSNDIEFTTFLDSDYPTRLLECDDAPIVLYYKGKPDFESKKIISIVGTRNATMYGVEFCSKFITELSERHPEVVIVSGLAFGIDVIAHNEALKNNLKTWAVLGHGLGDMYPAKHKKIAYKIIEEQGAILSDFHHGCKIEPSNFVKRNRIVAGLCDALIVVESGIRGGSMITANIANHYNKDVFSLPGNINSTYSEGCNRLIKTNRAHLIESVDDIEYIMNWNPEINNKEPKSIEFVEVLNEEEKSVVMVLKNHEYLDIDNIRRQTNLSPNKLSLCLLELEFKNIIKALPGKIFSLKIKNK